MRRDSERPAPHDPGVVRLVERNRPLDEHPPGRRPAPSTPATPLGTGAALLNADQLEPQPPKYLGIGMLDRDRAGRPGPQGVDRQLDVQRAGPLPVPPPDPQHDDQTRE